MRFLNSLAASPALRGIVATSLLLLAPGIAAAQSCPDFQAPAGQVLTQTAADLEQGVQISMLAGGDVDVSACDVDGYGYFVTAPDFEIDLADIPAGAALMLAVQSECDTMLLVNGPDGQYSFNDDYDGFDPALLRMDGAGVYDIWVGTYGTEVCDANLALLVGDASIFDATDAGYAAADTGACPDPALEGASLVLTAADLTAVHEEAMLAGGDVDIGGCMELPGFGNVITAPDYDLDIEGLAQNGQFTITVTSECDTILLVNDAAGEWQYNDDANNSHNPELKLTAGNGRYDVWVGTYDTEICDAVVTFADAGQRRTK